MAEVLREVRSFAKCQVSKSRQSIRSLPSVIIDRRYLLYYHPGFNGEQRFAALSWVCFSPQRGSKVGMEWNARGADPHLSVLSIATCLISFTYTASSVLGKRALWSAVI